MSTAHFFFLGRLNDFLPRDQKGQTIPVDFRGRQSIKHLAESLGVPHPEIGQVRVNAQGGTLEVITQDG
ncbi:MAG: Mut7-C RNAse domain-containing protein, partial [Anaerolineales bacterium]